MNDESKTKPTPDVATAQSVRPEDIDAALKRIREEYDGDLHAFFRDVKAKVLKQREVEHRINWAL